MLGREEGERRPVWLDDARRYYSRIEEGEAQPVSVFDAGDNEVISGESPGTLCLYLEPRSRYSPRLRVLDAGGRERGLIRREGPVPGLRYAMLRDGDLAWTLTVKSIVRRRHALEMADGRSWRFDTPFFSLSLTGTSLGAPRLIGVVPRTIHYWLVWIEPGWESLDLLAAVAFLHWQWAL
jgi:hypothetical protein